MLNADLSCDPEIPLLVICSRGLKHITTKHCIQMSIEALIHAATWMNLKEQYAKKIIHWVLNLYDISRTDKSIETESM